MAGISGDTHGNRAAQKLFADKGFQRVHQAGHEAGGGIS
jgi:hypothetical protein